MFQLTALRSTINYAIVDSHALNLKILLIGTTLKNIKVQLVALPVLKILPILFIKIDHNGKENKVKIVLK